jgi:arsenate reductase-like glutaredoxin family protein
MTAEHINSLTEYLKKQRVLFDKYDYVSVSLSKAELEYLLKQLDEHKEPTHEEVKDYCKARELSLITNELLAELIGRRK